MVALIRFLFGMLGGSKRSDRAIEKRKPQRGKWMTSPEGGWVWRPDPRDTAEPKRIEQ